MEREVVGVGVGGRGVGVKRGEDVGAPLVGETVNVGVALEVWEGVEEVEGEDVEEIVPPPAPSPLKGEVVGV